MLMEYVLTDRCAKKRLLYENVVREAAGGMLNHFLVEVTVKVGGGFRKRKDDMYVKIMVKVCEFGKAACVQR